MYEVYALKYSERDTTKCQFFYREASHDKLTLHYFVWLILGGPQPVLVDTGFLDDEAKSRGMRNYVTPASMVERAADPAYVDRIVAPAREFGSPEWYVERLDWERGAR